MRKDLPLCESASFHLACSPGKSWPGWEVSKLSLEAQLSPQEMMSQPWWTNPSTCSYHAGPLLMHKTLNSQTKKPITSTPQTLFYHSSSVFFLLGLIKTTDFSQQVEELETKPVHFLAMRHSLLRPLRRTGSMSCVLQAAPPCRLFCWPVWEISEGWRQ